MVISPPSHIKTPPIMEMLKPLSLIDQKACEKYRSELSLYDIQKAIYEKAVKKAVSQGSTAPGMPIPIPPRQTRHLVNDSTYEMLIAIAKDNPDGFLVYRDELVSWFHSINKESQKEARGLYLSGWNGTQSYATDRIGRGHLRAESVNISLIGTIQPNVLRQIVFDAISGGTGDDGLVQRFQLAVYPDPVREFTKMSRDQDFTEMLRYERLITRLVNLTPNDVGAVVDTSGNAYLSFDPSAQAFFDAWREDLERRIRSEQLEDKPAFLSHLGKYRSLMPKIALILHISDGLTGAITISSAKKAAAWLLMLEAHAHRIYHTATNPATKASNALAKAIRQRKVKDGFTRSELLMRELSGLRTSDEINAALRVLKDLQWVASREYRNTGGRPLERFFINPKLYID
jgi:putative DNA primase/helicase